MAKKSLLPSTRVEESFRKEIEYICSKEQRSIGNLITIALVEYKKNHYERVKHSKTTRRYV